jgi:hypothetical protein
MDLRDDFECLTEHQFEWSLTIHESPTGGQASPSNQQISAAVQQMFGSKEVKLTDCVQRKGYGWVVSGVADLTAFIAPPKQELSYQAPLPA